jgi:hypothetical protein
MRIGLARYLSMCMLASLVAALTDAHGVPKKDQNTAMVGLIWCFGGNPRA